MRLVFEHQQPFFDAVVSFDVDPHRAGVDFLAFVEIGQQTVFFELFSPNDGDIHQCQRLILAGLYVKLIPQRKVFLKAPLYGRVVSLHLVNDC